MEEILTTWARETDTDMLDCPTSVFISTAPADRTQCARLEVHLSLMRRQRLLETWHRSRCEPGQDLPREVPAHLQEADLVLLLISANYLSHDECYQFELPQALVQHNSGQTRVVPILISACDWHTAPFAHLKLLPVGAKPVTSWRNRNEAWANVASEIRALVDAIITQRLSNMSRSFYPDWPGETPPDTTTASQADKILSDCDKDIELEILARLLDGPVLMWGHAAKRMRTLVRHIAKELQVHYSEPALIINLRGSARQPLTAQAAMAIALDRVGAPSEGPPPDAILILEDARDAAQVAPLLREYAARRIPVLVTSRSRIDIEGVYARRLDNSELLRPSASRLRQPLILVGLFVAISLAALYLVRTALHASIWR